MKKILLKPQYLEEFVDVAINVYIVDDISNIEQNPKSYEAAVYIQPFMNGLNEMKYLTLMNDDPSEFYLEEVSTLFDAINLAYEPYSENNKEINIREVSDDEL